MVLLALRLGVRLSYLAIFLCCALVGETKKNIFQSVF